MDLDQLVLLFFFSLSIYIFVGTCFGIWYMKMDINLV